MSQPQRKEELTKRNLLNTFNLFGHNNTCKYTAGVTM